MCSSRFWVKLGSTPKFILATKSDMGQKEFNMHLKTFLNLQGLVELWIQNPNLYVLQRLEIARLHKTLGGLSFDANDFVAQ